MPAPDLAVLLERHRHDPTRLVQLLRDVQDSAGWISPATITELAGKLGLPRARVEGVAGFYSFFCTTPPGEYRVLFSDCITDQFLGSLALRLRLCSTLRVRPGAVRDDGRVSVDITSCTGLCEQGPALLVNGRAIGRLTEERIDLIARCIEARQPVSLWPAQLFTIEDVVQRSDVMLSSTLPRGQAVRAALQRGADDTLEQVLRSKLRGRGGAGFSTGEKWKSAKAAPGPTRFVVCNADEGEPGTFKDRVLLRHHLDLVLDGMTVCAWAIGAQRGFIYLRGEYLFLVDAMEAALAARRKAHLLGRDVLGHRGLDFDVELHLGAGAYVCGEESALIESLEGKRGIPRNRPPYPVTHGYLQQPTVVNNVETLAAAALIAVNGGDWYAGVGTPKSSGTKVHSVSGDCARPGLYEYPFGVTVRELLDACGAKDTQAVQVGGPSGVLLGPGDFGRRLSFEDVSSAGAFMVFGPQRDLLDVVVNFAHFFAHESCGFCTPCRAGTTLLKRSLDAIAADRGTRRDVKVALRLAKLMQQTSHCGLGHTAANPFLNLHGKFRPTLDRRLSSLDFLPTFDLDEALAPAREVTGRDDRLAHLEDP
ncbi:MAG: NAD(P)H-dependent oxidoreductase subunit E [Archangium sp.]|nr:NAD(P)H-dependent oxidoreductase subunit E [Archangium sp.]